MPRRTKFILIEADDCEYDMMSLYECPYCGNKGYVKCGSCQEWTSKNADTTHFKCAACENSGEVSGYIDSASGDLSQSNNRMESRKRWKIVYRLNSKVKHTFDMKGVL